MTSKPAVKSPSSNCTTLLALCGLSPSVLTETVWELWRTHHTIPNRVIALTTTKGRERIHAQLLDPTATPHGNRWEELRAAVGAGADQLVFAEEGKLENIRVFTHDGGELADVNTEAENTSVADCMVRELLEQQTHGPVIVSIAGGFKTMSALMVTALSLVGRPEDTANHVLVPEEVMRVPFYFPQQAHKTMESIHPVTNEISTVVAVDVEITLIPVPFISLRSFLVEEQLAHATFSGVRAAVQQRLDRTVHSLTLYRDHPVFTCNGRSVMLEPRSYFLLLNLGEMAKANLPPLTHQHINPVLRKRWDALSDTKVPLQNLKKWAPCRAWVLETRANFGCVSQSNQKPGMEQKAQAELNDVREVTRVWSDLKASLRHPEGCEALERACSKGHYLRLCLDPSSISIQDSVPAPELNAALSRPKPSAKKPRNQSTSK